MSDFRCIRCFGFIRSFGRGEGLSVLRMRKVQVGIFCGRYIYQANRRTGTLVAGGNVTAASGRAVALGIGAE